MARAMTLMMILLSACGAAAAPAAPTDLPPLAAGLCIHATGKIVIDGKLDEPTWRVAPMFALAYRFLPHRGLPLYATTAQCAWDETNFYVAFRVIDADIWAKHTERDANLWEDEVVEVYIDPAGAGRNYKEFEINPLGTVIDLNIEDPAHVGKEDVARYRKWNAPHWRTAVVVNGTVNKPTDMDRGWTAEMAIPFADLRVHPPHAGDTWRVQFYRIERPRFLSPCFSAWSPTDTFHRPSRFGRLTFQGNG